MNIIKLFYFRTVSTIYLFMILLATKFRDDDFSNKKISLKFINFNNRFTLKRFNNKKIAPEKIMVLLPHCVQLSDCSIKVTSDITKCKKCGKCDIGGMLKLKEKYAISVKIATGGTLARKHIKEIKPKVVIAVACERDLVTGIYDSYPMPVIGFFNDRINGPCVDTKADVASIENVIKQLIYTEENE